MIVLTPPHAGLNDPRSPIRVHMDHTFWVGKHEAHETIVNRIVRAADETPGGVLSNVVINCHGLEGFMQLGEGFVAGDAYHFRAWRGKVRKVWIIACLVAQRWGHNRYSVPAAIAREAQCYVVASTETQVDNRRHLAYGHLDTFEGLVLSFGPSGRVTWSRRYPSTFTDSRGHMHFNPD